MFVHPHHALARLAILAKVDKGVSQVRDGLKVAVQVHEVTLLDDTCSSEKQQQQQPVSILARRQAPQHKRGDRALAVSACTLRGIAVLLWLISLVIVAVRA